MKKLRFMAVLSTAAFMSFWTVYCTTSNQMSPPVGRTQNLFEDKTCIKRTTLNAFDRLNKFPFSRAAKVRLVSFEYDASAIAEDGYLFSSSLNRFHRVNYREIKELDAGQIDTLTDLLFNYDYKTPPSGRPAPKCYRPRNGIMFYDLDSTAFAAIEICFECQRFMTYPEQPILPEQVSKNLDFCNQKSDMLRQFFKEHGVLYGSKLH
ncbi:MAG: hypothetical protein RL757_176 [Bacteroidota bacterium]|jgi:hypothetical protein